MNYRHAFHAGNFADVVKHAVLCRVLVHLLAKEKPFCIVDTHAGAGVYDLAGQASIRTQEWRNGIGRLLERPPAGEAGSLLAPYLAQIRAANEGDAIKRYPGSPLLARAFSRADDRMIFCELHPQEHAALQRTLAGERRARVIESDGWAALKAHLPPQERRGLVLIDPPFEDTDEFQKMLDGLGEGHRRFPTGSFLAWYPVKNEHEIGAFERRLAQLAIPKIFRVRLAIDKARADGPLNACGLIVVNPPWTLEKELNLILPALAERLGREGHGSYRADWLSP